MIIVNAEKAVLHKYIVQGGKRISEIVGKSILTSIQNISFYFNEIKFNNSVLKVEYYRTKNSEIH